MIMNAYRLSFRTTEYNIRHNTNKVSLIVLVLNAPSVI